MCRSLEDGLLMLDPFVRFVLCDPCCTAAYQPLRLGLMSTLSLHSVDNLTLLRYLLQLIPFMPVLHLDFYSLNCCHSVSLCS